MEEASCPQSLCCYNCYMGGVGKFEQYKISWKFRHWWVNIITTCNSQFVQIVQGNAVASQNKLMCQLAF